MKEITGGLVVAHTAGVKVVSADQNLVARGFLPEMVQKELRKLLPKVVVLRHR